MRLNYGNLTFGNIHFSHAGRLVSISQSSPPEPPSSRLRLVIAPRIPYAPSPATVVSQIPEKTRLMGMPRHEDRISHPMKETLQKVQIAAMNSCNGDATKESGSTLTIKLQRSESRLITKTNRCFPSTQLGSLPTASHGGGAATIY
jgi:hypothetical protein